MNQVEIDRAIKSKSIVETTSVHGFRLRCRILRQSNKTQGLTVELSESVSGSTWKVGDLLHVKPYDIEPRQPRPDELQANLMNAYLRTITDLQEMVDDGLRARQKFAAAILKEGVGEPLADQVRWGHGVKADIKAAYAAYILEAVNTEQRDLKDILVQVAANMERNLLGHSFSFSSSSAFSNAVEIERADAARDVREFCLRHAERMVEARAEMEVL